MKKILEVLLILVFGLTSCNNNLNKSDDDATPDAKTDAKTEIGKVNDFLKQYEEPSQIFNVSANKPTQVTGKQGTIISINPENLITENGQPVEKNITVELKELTNQEQLLKGNAQTASNGKLLVSGGAYFINMTSDGKQLQLKEGKSLSVEFPKITNKEMSLFYGQRDSLGRIDWQQTEQKFENRTKQKMESEIVLASEGGDSVSEVDAILDYIEQESKRPLSRKEKKAIEERNKNSALADKLYKAVELKQFGWINCDRFYEVPNTTNLQYTFNSKDSITSANVYLVFKDINSILQDCYFSNYDKEFNSGFQNIPLGAKTQIIAISAKNGKTLTFKSDLTIKANETVQLTLKESSQDKIVRLFQSN